MRSAIVRIPLHEPICDDCRKAFGDNVVAICEGRRHSARALVIEPSHSILSGSLRFDGVFCMFVTEEEAAEIYAKACRSWYRDEAEAVVNSKIRTLKAKGDQKGVRAWTQVRRSLEHRED